jgi:hypothetical protein
VKGGREHRKSNHFDLGRFMQGLDEESLERCCIIIHGL